MNYIAIFLYEWKHFIHTPFKLVALLLFVVAGVYGLHNGAALFKKQTDEIEKINEKVQEQKQEYISYYEKGEKGPADRPWIDLSTPFWAIWNTPSYHFKNPSPALVFSIGQAEQYGFYKRVDFGSSPYDADMAEEIANPERLQSGTLDFSFVVLYLLPLLLLVWLYNIKGVEADNGFLPLIFTQTGSESGWLVTRVAFYAMVLLGGVLSLMFYGAFLTGVLQNAGLAFLKISYWLLLYLVFWGVVFAFIIQKGNSSVGNSLKMVGVWLLLVFIIPGAVHQWVSIQQPASLMTELIDAQRDEVYNLYDEPDSVIQTRLNELFPEIVNSPIIQEESKKNMARNRSFSALANELVKESITKIESSNEYRNKLIRFSYWFNPITFMQNKFNELSQTHYQDYQNYRNEIQSLVDRQVRVMVLDIWNDIEVDKEKYLEYNKTLGVN